MAATITLKDGRVLKTGAHPTPRHKLAAAMPYRARGTAPNQFLRLPQHLDMWDNDHDGDCVTAEEAFNQACCGVFISSREVVRWATAHGVLNGADLSEVLDWMAQKGFQQDGNTYGVGPKASIDYTNLSLLQNAIYNGTVKIGMAAAQLGGVVTQHNGWFGHNFRTDHEEDHCTSLTGYGRVDWLLQQLGGSLPSGYDGSRPGVGFFTWSTVGVLDLQSMLNVTGEAWSRTPPHIVLGSGTPTPDSVTLFQDPEPTPTPPPMPPGPPAPTPMPFVVNVPQQPVYIGPFNVGHVPAFTVGGTMSPQTEPEVAGEHLPQLLAWALANRPDFAQQYHSRLPGFDTAAIITLPPWLLPVLKVVCAGGTVVLPAPWNMVLGVLCSLVPKGLTADQGLKVVVPSWLPPLLRMLCAEVNLLPDGYAKEIAGLLCAIIVPPASLPRDFTTKTPCGCGGK